MVNRVFIMQLNASPNGSFSGLGELLQPLTRVFQNVGQAISTLINNSENNQDLLLISSADTPSSINSRLDTSVGLHLYTCENLVLTTFTTERDNVSGNLEYWTATKSTSAWSWAAEHQNSPIADPLGGDNIKAPTLFNRILEPKTGDTHVVQGAGVGGIVLSQTLDFVGAFAEGNAIDFASYVTGTVAEELDKIAEFDVASAQFGE